ncbi:MAG: hypothetical protein RLZZ518_1358 [Actinomycetota bacterium]
MANKTSPVGVRIGLRGVAQATVDGAGVVHPDEWRGAECGWWVAASDRWHDPRKEPSIRQRQIDGTPVVETKVAVPNGDVVQRVYVVADQGGCVVMQVDNHSPQPVAIAVPTASLSSTAAAGGAVPQGVCVPDGVSAFPLAHRSSITFAWPLERSRFGRRRAARPIEMGLLPSSDQVVRGWVQSGERASRLTVASHRLVSARSTVLMASTRDIDDLLQSSASLGVLAIGERVRMGDPAREWVSPVADALQRIARKPSPSRWSARALVLAAHVFARAEETAAVSDAVRVWQRLLDTGSLPFVPPTGTGEQRGDLDGAVEFLSAAEEQFVRADAPLHANLLPGGIPAEIRGVNAEAHGLIASPQHRISLAMRWHGENVALLWEVEGPPGLLLHAPQVDASFATSQAQGEALLRVAP